MGKKHKHPEHENLERWLVSYADFITLLFATFTALYALTFADLQKIKKNTAQAISQGFKQQSLFNGLESLLKGNAAANEKPNPLADEGGAGEGVMPGSDDVAPPTPQTSKARQEVQEQARDLTEIVQDLNKEMKEIKVIESEGEGLTGGKQGGGQDGESAQLNPVQLSMQERGVRISLDSRLFFTSGSAALNPAIRKVLDRLANHLKTLAKNHMIHIEGHTDNQPIGTVQFPSNWELSGARAASVVRYFIKYYNIPANALAAVGYAETQPIASNQTTWGRSRNRRIDIIILTKLLSHRLNPTHQARLEHVAPLPKEKGGQPPAKKTEVRLPIFDTSTTPQPVSSLQSDGKKRQDVTTPSEDGISVEEFH